MPFDYNKYYKNYKQHTSNFNLSFNLENPKDLKVLEILNKQPNKSRFVKELIRDSEKNENK